MKLLVIGTDTAIFEPHSEARSRIESYGRLLEELHVIIYSPPGFLGETLASGVKLYPTKSRWFFRRPFDAVRIGQRIVGEHRIDAISVQDPAESGLAGWLLKRKTGLPLHMQLHNDILSPYFRRNSWKERLRYWIARFIIPRGDLFRVVSQRIRKSLVFNFQFPISKIVVLPIFVDRQALAKAVPQFDLHQRYPEFDFIILMVSRLTREKNISLAIKAVAELLKEFATTGLVIVGDGPERKNLEFRIQNLELADSVRLEGWQKDLVSYYKTADLYLLTSAFEGYGRTVIEAAAAGLPVVMTDVGVAGETIRDGETGRVVPVGDKKALVKTLGWAQENYAEMRRMAKGAKDEVLAMGPRSWKEYLRRYENAFSYFSNQH